MDNKVTKSIIVIIILFGLYILNIQQQNSYSNEGEKFLTIDENLIKKIIISSDADAIELNMQDSTWVISGNDSLTIKQNMVGNLLTKLSEIKQLHVVTTKEEKWNLYEVDAPTGTHLALVGSGGNTLAYYVFGQTNEFNKCYVRTDQNMEVYMLNSNIMFQLKTDPNFWGEILKEEVMIDSTLVPTTTF